MTPKKANTSGLSKKSPESFSRSVLMFSNFRTLGLSRGSRTCFLWCSLTKCTFTLIGTWGIQKNRSQTLYRCRMEGNMTVSQVTFDFQSIKIGYIHIFINLNY